MEILRKIERFDSLGWFEDKKIRGSVNYPDELFFLSANVEQIDESHDLKERSILITNKFIYLFRGKELKTQ
jgi:hypothetical protein